jgi:hypothetical protein
VATSAFAASPEETLATAERAFAEGVALRNDSELAKVRFAQAASAYDDLWTRGYRTVTLAQSRAHAHRLAGDLPRCIAALHDGLGIARYSRVLQVELADAQSRVELPLEGELALQCRPRVTRTVSSRMSPADAWYLVGALSLFACAGVARFAMTRRVFWLAFAGVWTAALIVLGVLWLNDSRYREQTESLPLLIVSQDATLRRGNAVEYPAKIEPAIPRGAEVRELSRRGGWVQVQLPGGAIGWLPESATIRCE